MAKEAALWVVIIRLTLPILKGIYAEVSTTSSMFYALVMNTVKLCIRQKKTDAPLQQCSKSHALVWMERYNTLWAGNSLHSHFNLHLPPPFTRAGLFHVLQLTSVRIASAREKRRGSIVTCWLKLSARHWSNPSRYWSLCSTSEQLIPQTDACSWVSKSSLCQQSWRDSFNFETHNIDSNPAQAFIVVISTFFYSVLCQHTACCLTLHYSKITISEEHICLEHLFSYKASHGHRADLVNDGSNCVVSLMFDLSPSKQIRIAK